MSPKRINSILTEFDRDIQGQKFVELQEKSAFNLIKALF